MGKRQIRRGMEVTAPRRKPAPQRYTPPTKYTDQQLAYFDIDDLITDLEATRRQHPNDPEFAGYIADVERKIAAKSAAFRTAYGVDPVEWGRAQGFGRTSEARASRRRVRPARVAAGLPRAAARSHSMAWKDIHPDVEFAVDDGSGQQMTFSNGNEASAFAMAMAMSQGSANLDVLVWSAAGALAYGGDDAVARYREDPEASVFERYEVKVNFVGMVP